MKNAWMPRVGLAYSPGTSGKTSIRAGFGRSFDVLVDNFGLLTLPPQVTTTVDVTGLNQGGFLAGGGIPPNASTARFDQAEARAGTGGYVPNQTRPESLQWNIGIQHVFHENYTFESRYLGTRGIHLPVQAQLNRIPVVNGANALPFYTTAPSQATLNGLTSTLAKTDRSLQCRRVRRSRVSRRRLQGHHHLLPALGQLHLSRLGQPVDAPLHQRPAVHRPLIPSATTSTIPPPKSSAPTPRRGVRRTSATCAPTVPARRWITAIA